MAPHSSTLAWKILWMEEPGGLQSMGVTKSRTQLSDFTFTFHFHALEKEMATHSSVLAWRIPGTGEPWWTAVYGVAQSRTRLKRLSSSKYCGIMVVRLKKITIVKKSMRSSKISFSSLVVLFYLLKVSVLQQTTLYFSAEILNHKFQLFQWLQK